MNIKFALVREARFPRDKGGWCMLLSTHEQAQLVNKGAFQKRAQDMIHGKGGYEKEQTGRRINIIEFAEFENQLAANWFRHISSGEIIMKWVANNGYAIFNKGWEVLELMELPYPEMPNENHNADIVVCENDAEPEERFINELKEKFADKRITTLTLFSLRTKESLVERFTNASIIAFTTTFTNWDWYEKLLDVIIENNLQSKTIYGHNKTKEEYPDYIRQKMQQLDKTITILNI